MGGTPPKLGLQLGGLFLQVHPHQPRRDERHEQQSEDIAEDIGDGVSGGDIGVLLIYLIFRQPKLRHAPDAVPIMEDCVKAPEAGLHGVPGIRSG